MTGCNCDYQALLSNEPSCTIPTLTASSYTVQSLYCSVPTMAVSLHADVIVVYKFIHIASSHFRVRMHVTETMDTCFVVSNTCYCVVSFVVSRAAHVHALHRASATSLNCNCDQTSNLTWVRTSRTVTAESKTTLKISGQKPISSFALYG